MSDRAIRGVGEMSLVTGFSGYGVLLELGLAWGVWNAWDTFGTPVSVSEYSIAMMGVVGHS